MVHRDPGHSSIDWYTTPLAENISISYFSRQSLFTNALPGIFVSCLSFHCIQHACLSAVWLPALLTLDPPAVFQILQRPFYSAYGQIQIQRHSPHTGPTLIAFSAPTAQILPYQNSSGRQTVEVNVFICSCFLHFLHSPFPDLLFVSSEILFVYDSFFSPHSSAYKNSALPLGMPSRFSHLLFPHIFRL